jgi:uncharacterized protein (DUF1501 family)
MADTTRRSFMMGCSAAIAAMAGSRLSFAAFGDPDASREVLVTIFLRGGADLLSLVAPIDGADRGHYLAARPQLALPVSGDGALLPVGAQFGLHAAAAPLHTLFQGGKVAIVHACGMNVDTRSHFDAQEFIELGTPGTRSIATGWITRHLRTAPGMPAGALMPSLAVGNAQPTSLLGDRETVSMDDPDDFDIGTGPWLWRDAQRLALRRLYGRGDSAAHRAGIQAMNAMDLVEAFAGDDVPPANGAVYPDTDFGRHMRMIGQIIRLGIGLRAVTIDLGGWDTHENQAYGAGGWFGDLTGSLTGAMAALYRDLDDGVADPLSAHLTVVVLSEFGRRVRENADRGTDHGHGNPIVVLGGSVNGGLYGAWPGLAPDALYDGADVAVTTDYRRVLSEIVVRRFRNPYLSQVFPGYAGYSPLGVVQGSDLVTL